MTTPASNNRFKGVSFQPQATPATPATGDGRLFLDTSDGLLKWIDDAGVVTEVIGGGGVTDHGALTGLSDDDHTQYVLRSILTTNGDLFTRAAGAVSRLGIGSTGDVLTVSGGAPTWAAPAGGGSTPTGLGFVRTYAQSFANSTTHTPTIDATASGHRLIVVIDSYARDVNSITCTNVTFTEVLALNFSTGVYLSVYVGVVSGGSSGTTITITCTGSNIIVSDIYEVTDALTPTAGASVSLTDTSAAAKARFAFGSLAATAGDFFIIAAAENDGSGAGLSNIRSNHALIDTGPRATGEALTSGIGRAVCSTITGYYTGGTSGADMAAGIVIVS